MTTTITVDEVSTHCKETDCWVIISEKVYDVTHFLKKHPGGVSSIAKFGRAGCDVTNAFEQIGHSERATELLKSMQIGIVSPETSLEYNNNEDEEEQSLLNDNNSKKKQNIVIDDADKEAAPLWHANRRKAILRDHPEVAELMGSNPWTCVIGLATVFIHCATCIYVQRSEVSWWFMFVLAYTVGALCKMFQFAVNHDICHDTAGSFVASHDLLKRCAMQLFTLPSVGGTMHVYYENQHLGHHTSLGTQALTDLESKGGEYLRIQNLRKMLFFPESDGDLLAVGNMSYGRILKNWRLFDDTNKRYLPREYFSNSIIATIHRSKPLKIMSVLLLHIQHHGLLSFAMAHMGFIIPPISIPAFLCPSYFESWLEHFMRISPDYSKIITPETKKFLVSFIVRTSASQGLHTWLWICLNIYLLFWYRAELWSWNSVFKGFFYLYLSELFLYGFAFHPYMGYFLGVHRSGGTGFKAKSTNYTNPNICQPTMSTYGFMSALCSMNLTHHVEHHDFPSVPWNRLPEITRLAPEYYEDLEQSSSFVYTIFQWFDHSEGWSYGCH